MLTVRTSENTVITSFRLISERQDFSSVRTGENTVRARARIQYLAEGKSIYFFRDIVFRPAWAAFKVYFINLGFLDGKIGFIFAANHYCYTLQKYLRYYLLKKTKGYF